MGHRVRSSSVDSGRGNRKGTARLRSEELAREGTDDSFHVGVSMDWQVSGSINLTRYESPHELRQGRDCSFEPNLDSAVARR